MTRKRNALLIYPQVPGNTYWSFKYALKFVGKKSAMPPLGLITIASYFPETYRLKLVDLNIEPLRETDVEWADAVFISAMIVQKESFAQVVDLCNRLKTPVVAGGPYPSSSHEKIAGVDHFVLGEVENSFKDFLRDFEQGKAKTVYQPPEKPCMADSIIPRFDLLNLKAYSSMSIQYSRGCPFRCEFCDIWRVYGNTPRLKTHKKIIAELNSLHKLGWRGPVFIVDDNFIGNKHKVKKELLPALSEWQQNWRFPFRFFTEASINIANDSQLLKAMRNAGFDEVFIGIETPSRKALAETGKIQNMKYDMRQSIRTIQDHGIEVMAGFIIGFDSDTEDVVDRQIEFIQRSGIPQAMVGILTALPGTKLYRRLETEGRLLHAASGNNTDCNAVNFRPRMGLDKLKHGYNRILASIYDKNMRNYFKRCSNLLDHLGTPSCFSREVRVQEIRALVISVLRQPFTSYGHQYVKFLTKSLFRNRVMFSEAVRLSIVGHHFHKITQEMLKVEKVSRFIDEKYDFLHRRIKLYSSVSKNSYKDKRRYMARTFKQKKKILRAMRLKVNSIHSDFRQDIHTKYLQAAEKIQEQFNLVILRLENSTID